MDLLIPANAAARLRRPACFCGSDSYHFLDRSYSPHCLHGQEQVAVLDQVHPPCPRHRWENVRHLCCFLSWDERALTDTGVLLVADNSISFSNIVCYGVPICLDFCDWHNEIKNGKKASSGVVEVHLRLFFLRVTSWAWVAMYYIVRGHSTK